MLEFPPVEYHHCFEFQCSARQAQNAHAVFTRMSEYGPPNPQFLSTLITSPSAADFFYFLKPLGTGQPCVICQDKTHLMEFPLRVGTGARCVRAEGSREPRLTAGAMGRQCVKEDPPCSRGQCLVFFFCVTLPSQDQPPEHKWTFTFLDDLPELPEHEVQEPDDTHKKGKPCLILFKTRSVKTHFTSLFLSHKTRSVQDTICSRHISRCLFLSHTPCQLLRFR